MLSIYKKECLGIWHERVHGLEIKRRERESATVLLQRVIGENTEGGERE